MAGSLRSRLGGARLERARERSTAPFARASCRTHGVRTVREEVGRYEHTERGPAILHQWFSHFVGILTCGLAVATIVAAGLLAWVVCRRYSPRAVVAATGCIVAFASLLPWLSYRSGRTAAQTRPKPLPQVTAVAFAHDLDRGRVLEDARLTTDPMARAGGSTVFETKGGTWTQVAGIAGLTAKESSLFRRHLVSKVPEAVAGRVRGDRGLALSYFITIEVFVTMAGTLVFTKALTWPRRMDADQWLANLVAECSA